MSYAEIVDYVASSRSDLASQLGFDQLDKQGQLQTIGLITTSSDGIVILKPAELHAETWSREV